MDWNALVNLLDDLIDQEHVQEGTDEYEAVEILQNLAHQKRKEDDKA